MSNSDIKSSPKSSSKTKSIKKIENWLDTKVEDRYGKKEELEHILELPDTQIGSTEFENYNFWVPGGESDDNSNIKFTRQDIKFTPGLYKIIDEILVNAYDQAIRLTVIKKQMIEQNNLDPDDEKSINIELVKNIKIEINMETGMISVYNDGEGVDVAEHQVHKVYVPQMIFGDMRTSANYNKNISGIKIVGGRNGFGAKLANIFSTRFIVETLDRRRHLKFVQQYENNMSVRGEPVITKDMGKGYTKITFYPDLSRFGYENGFDETLYKIVQKRAYDLAACTDPSINVYLNGEKIDCKNFEKFVTYHLGSAAEHPRIYKKFNDRWEVVACLSPDQKFDQVSFVNGVSTIRGGKHVEYVCKQIVNKLKTFIQTKKKVNVKPEHVKDNLMLFVKCSVDNAGFDTQTKEALTTTPSKFGSECDIDDDFIDKLATKCGVMDSVMQWHELKSNINLKKTDGTKRNTLNIPKLEDAAWAGGSKSDLACLILTEGDSAKALAMAGRSAYKNESGEAVGDKIFGIFPLRGKVLNVDGASAEKIIDNKEITSLKQILALQEGKTYKDTKSLRYGSILVMCDQDEDGSHIKGLLINLFKTKWPSLFEMDGFITSLLTPVIKAKRGNKVKSFYSIPQFEKWKQQNNNGKGWTTKYYKGLGTSTSKEAKEYFQEFKKNVYTLEPPEENGVSPSYDMVDLAFSKTRADDRKDWLKVYNSDDILDYSKSAITYSDFINKDLKHFSHSDNRRSIPSMIDGFKESQRKIMFGVRKRGNIGSDGIKVAQLGGYVAEHSAYHHGEQSIYSTMCNMAQNFVGSNNINILEPLGQFGSRLRGGKDAAAARYIFTRMEKIAECIFNKLDDPLYKHLEDDGQQIEPEFYVPIIPMSLVNGSKGIGTGYSTYVPCYNPLEIIQNVKNMINGQEPTEMIPWYRGFKGFIYKVGPNSYVTKGLYNVIDSKTVEVTELPVGMWTEDYSLHLDKLRGVKTPEKSPKKQAKYGNINLKAEKEKEKEQLEKVPKILKKYDTANSDSTVKYTLHFEDKVLDKLLSGEPDKKGISQFEKILKLTTCISTTNMTLYDADNCLKKYKNTTEILQEFFEVRQMHYIQRRKYMLNKLNEEKMYLTWKAKFIMSVVSENPSDKIYVNKRSRQDIYHQLETKDFPKEIDKKLVHIKDIPEIDDEDNTKAYNYLLDMPIYNLTEERIQKLLDEKNKKDAEYDSLKEKTPADLWIADLDELDAIYSDFMKKFWKEQGKENEQLYNEQINKREKHKNRVKPKLKINVE
jgi:DNA topoisomerase-2